MADGNILRASLLVMNLALYIGMHFVDKFVMLRYQSSPFRSPTAYYEYASALSTDHYG